MTLLSDYKSILRDYNFINTFCKIKSFVNNFVKRLYIICKYCFESIFILCDFSHSYKYYKYFFT